MTTGKKIYILYGSQTGNSEQIAAGLCSRCTEELHIHNIELGTLNSINKNIDEFKANACLMLIVCSTTGNGDAPENADAFWRTIKLRSASKTLFEHLPYCVLGLGDTNYDKFCHMGKSIDKRLHELGGNRLMPIECADEATGLEEVVDKWTDKCVELISKFTNTDED